MMFPKLILTAFAGLSLASTAIAAPWSNGSSRGFEYHDYGSVSEGFKLVCDSDPLRSGSFLEVRVKGIQGDTKYRVKFGSTSFPASPLFPSDPKLTFLVKKMSNQEKKSLHDAYASSPIVQVYKGETLLLELDLGDNRPALCF